MNVTALKKPEINMQARPTSLTLLDYTVRLWGLTVPPDVGLDQLLLPEFWAHVAVRQLRPFDDVRVSCEDGTWTALLFTRDAERGGARMGIIWHRDFEADDNVPELIPDVRERYEIKFRGPQHKYVVVRLSDKKELISGLSKQQAMEYAAQRQMQGI